MKSIAVAGLFLAWSAVACLGQNDSGSEPDKRKPPPTPGVLACLNQRIAEASLDEAPLDQVINWINEITPLNVVVRWQTLEYAGVERDKPITLDVHNLRLSQVLWLLLEEAGGPDLKLAYRADSSLLLISTREDLESEMIVRVYDVRDLLTRVPDFLSAPHVSLDQASSGNAGPFSANGSTSNGEERSETADSRETQAKMLAELITETFDPDSWVVNGGSGTISTFRDLLVVRNNSFVHQQLGGIPSVGE